MPQAVILSAVRTPIGKFMGTLTPFKAPDLGALAIREALTRANVPGDDVTEVIMGCVLQGGMGQNPARQAALAAGVPDTVSSFTVNKVCGSGMKSVMLATQGIMLGDEQVVVAGGMESMTNAPYFVNKVRSGLRLGHGTRTDLMVHDGLWDAYNDVHIRIVETVSLASPSAAFVRSE